MRLKRWESPRREGRNDKGKKNPARQRQIKAQTQALRRKLKGDEKRDSNGSLFSCLNFSYSNTGENDRCSPFRNESRVSESAKADFVCVAAISIAKAFSNKKGGRKTSSIIL
jgi:hypothetical protein